MGVLCLVLFCKALLSVFSSFVIIVVVFMMSAVCDCVVVSGHIHLLFASFYFGISELFAEVEP